MVVLAYKELIYMILLHGVELVLSLTIMILFLQILFG